MGMDAKIIGIGSFTQEIIDYLSYDREYYEGVKEGAIVATEFFRCNTSSQSKELADALGIADPYDLGYHYILENKVNWDYLRELSDNNSEWESANMVDRLHRLLRAQFICVYCPDF